jgi:hypothetical protein
MSARSGQAHYPPKVLLPVQWTGFIWLGFAFYVILALLALEPVRLGARLWPRRPYRRPEATRIAGEPTAEPATRTPAESRRLFLARGLALGAGAVALGAAGVGILSANGPPVVRRLPVTLAGLDASLDGFRIVTFSDAHLSSTYGGRRFERVVEPVNAQRPDVVAIIGDLVDGELEHLREEVAPIRDLASEQGVFFVTGNHEYYVDTQAWLRHLPTLGVDVLRNERVGRAAVAHRPRHPTEPAGDRRLPPLRGHPAVRELGYRLLGPAHAGRRLP